MATTLDEWAAYIESRAGKALADLLRQELVRTALLLEADAKRTAGRVMRVRTGRLRNSIRARVVTEGTADPYIQLRATGRYAAMQEYGGTIRSKRPGGYLAIPLGPALTAAGVLRGEFNRPLRGVKGLFFIQSKAGNKLLVRRRGKDGIVPLFVLRRSVTLRERRYLRDPMTRAHERLTRVLGPELAEAFIPGGGAL